MRLRHARRPRVDWTGWQPSDSVVSDLRRYMRRHRRANIGAYLLVVAVASGGHLYARESRQAACAHQNQTRAALRTIIKRGDANLAKLLQEGTINRAQYERSLGQSRNARRLLGDIDCTSA